METRQTTDASLVFDLLIRATYTTPWMDEAFVLTPSDWHYECPNSDVLALQQDWDYQYSHGQDETHV